MYKREGTSRRLAPCLGDIITQTLNDMKRIFVSVLIVLFIANNVISQVSIRILDYPKKIYLCQKEVNFKVEIENKTDTNYLFYRSNYIASTEYDSICKNDLLASSRFWIQLIDENGVAARFNTGSETFPARIDKLEEKPIDFFKEFRSDSLIINSNTKIIKKISMPLKWVLLHEGKYKVKVGLISGKYTSEILDENIIREDETRTNSKLFFGCCESDFFEINVVK